MKMNAIKLRETIQERLQEIREKCIWERALGVTQLCGRTVNKEPHLRRSGFDTYIEMELAVQIGEKYLRILICTSRYCQKNSSVSIKLSGKTVFDASENFDRTLHLTRETVVTTNGPEEAGTDILVVSYIPGEWTQWLDQNIINDALRKQKEKERQEDLEQQQRRIQQFLEEEKKRPLRQDELERAKRFGITV